MRIPWALALLCCSCAAPSAAPRIPTAQAERAERYAAEADAQARGGRLEDALSLATRALVVRIAACGLECPEVGLSFIQLGDLRRRKGQLGWAAQSYRRASESLSAHGDTHGSALERARARLHSVCRELPPTAPPCADSHENRAPAAASPSP